MNLIPESMIMRMARRIGCEGIAWSLRRLHCPVPADALVLEVGSGGKPYFRANVLLDGYEEGAHRYGLELVMDRPFVLGDMENLPFGDKAFDFVIASHVLEHSAHPEKFLRELERVAKAGYIETPEAFLERINPYHFHKLEVTIRNDRLRIRKKPAWVTDPELTEMYEQFAKRYLVRELVPRRPYAFNIRYFWKETISFEIVNPETDADWLLADVKAGERKPESLKARIYRAVLRVINALWSQRRRNRHLELLPLLRCPRCSATRLTRTDDDILCASCMARYAVKNGVPVMYSPPSIATATSPQTQAK